jgi:hypothetical protein
MRVIATLISISLVATLISISLIAALTSMSLIATLMKGSNRGFILRTLRGAILCTLYSGGSDEEEKKFGCFPRQNLCFLVHRVQIGREGYTPYSEGVYTLYPLLCPRPPPPSPPLNPSAMTFGERCGSVAAFRHWLQIRSTDLCFGTTQQRS